LPAELTIYVVRELREHWLQALDAGGAEPFALAAGDVEQVDAAGLQLLLALRHTLAQQGRSLLLQAPSAALRSACLNLGLAALLDCPPDTGGAA